MIDEEKKFVSKLPAKPDEAKWAAMPFIDQLANIGSEVGRTAKWVCKGKESMAESAYLRALDLFDLTIKFRRLGSEGRESALFELCRSRDMFTGAYLDKDCDTLNWLDSYFGQFATASRLRR